MGLRNIILGLTLGATSIFLSGCISSLQAASLSPDEVMINFSQSLKRLESFNYDINLELTGNLPNGLGGAVESASIKFSGTVGASNKENIATQAIGQIATQVQGVPVILNGQVISLEGYTYFQIQDLKLPFIQSLGIKQLGQWYKIKHPIAGMDANLGSVQILSDTTNDTVPEIETLFEIVEVLMDETIKDARSYHYRVRAKTDIFISFLDQLEGALPLNIEPAVSKQVEGFIFDLWLSKRTFFPTRISLRDVYHYQDVPIGIDLDVILFSHNSTQPITAPTSRMINEYDDLLGGFSVPF